MKKFYTLLAAAAVAMSASALQIAPKAMEAMPANSELKVKKSLELPTKVAQLATTLRSNPSTNDITGTYYLKTHLEYTGGSADEMTPFTMEAGAEPGYYILKGFYWGEDAKDLTATLELLQDGGQQYSVLCIPSGQTWFVNQGSEYKIYPGLTTSQGWGADFNTGGEDDVLMFAFVGDGFIPVWSFGEADENVGIAYATPYGNSYSGNVLTDVYMYWSNATLDGLVTEDGETAYEYEEDLFIEQAYNRGRLIGVNIYGIGGMPNPLELRLGSEDGVVTAENCVAANFYTDNSYQTTTPGYYTNAEVVNGKIQDMTVTASCSLSDGKTVINFGDYLVVWVPEQDGLGFDVYNPVITATSDLGLGGPAAIQNVAIDNNNAPVEYFNLQGQRVENPANGQLVIRRQGTQVEKIIIR